ncbi:MAG: ParB/RepB/Spo0J family partition protein [Oscillospiraceae bacterium]|nr:ParB/RepB/Spo0J family partition protein [Oscillospiraceae bacterium]
MQCQKIRTYMETGRVIFLPVKQLHANPAQPRSVFREDALQELCESIRKHGILQPLSVRRTPGGYQIICGERRLRAGILAGLSEVPCIVMNMTDQESGMAALVENLQRENLDFIEEAKGISLLISQWSMSQEQAARVLGKSQSSIANKLRLLRHSAPVLDTLRQHSLTERHARALLKLEDEKIKLQVIEHIARMGLSVTRTEQYIDDLLKSGEKKPPRANVDLFLKTVTQNLSRIQESGVAAISERRETDSQIVLTITIPK